MNFQMSDLSPRRTPMIFYLILWVATAPMLQAKSWKFSGVSKELEAELVGMNNGWVVLKDTSGKSFEFALDSFTPPDQQYLNALSSGIRQTPATATPSKSFTSAKDYNLKTTKSLTNQVITLSDNTSFHVTDKGDPIPGCSFIFNSPDAWLFLDHVPPSVVTSKMLDRMHVAGKPANSGTNVRVVQYGSGTVIIPHEPNFTALTLFGGKSLSGDSISLKVSEKYSAATLAKLKGTPASFILKRGYTATLARNKDGTGPSRNYVAQDHDVVINELPVGLNAGVGFIRIFPWRWVSKKGIAGGNAQKLQVGWFYNWNISTSSSPDLEYVGIRQNRHWPSLDQAWNVKEINQLLGFNEPDGKDQANLTVDQAISIWPTLLATGLRLGSPAPTDGGLPWLYQFIDKADAAGLRVDFVAVHYYQAVGDPKDAKGAADQFYRFLKGVHDRVKRPLWITEWNNGANWTKAPDPNEKQQRDAVEKMIEMLDATPFVERYALYNWVEDCRQLVRKDGSLTPAGEVYRDRESPLSFTQPK